MERDASIILGIVGEIGSGKDTVTGYIVKNYDAGYYRYSKILRDILDSLHLSYERKNLALLATAIRETFGEDILSKAVDKELNKMDKHVVVADGLRKPAEAAYFQENPNFRMLYIETSIEKCYERILARNQKIDDANKTFEEFKEDHKRKADSQILSLKDGADFVLNNNGSLEDLYTQIDRILAQFQLTKTFREE